MELSNWLFDIVLLVISYFIFLDPNLSKIAFDYSRIKSSKT